MSELTTMPSMLPLDVDGKVIANTYKLIYSPSCILFFSYQHAIASYEESRLLTRPGYWGRRRSNRLYHCEVVINCCRRLSRQRGLRIDGAADENDFFLNWSRLTGTTARAAAKKGNGGNKRRITL